MGLGKSVENEVLWYLGRAKHLTDPFDKFVFYSAAFNLLYSSFLGKGTGWNGDMEQKDLRKLLAILKGEKAAKATEELSHSFEALADRVKVPLKGTEGLQKACKGEPLEALAGAVMIASRIRGVAFRSPRMDIQPIAYEVLIACNSVLERVGTDLLKAMKT